MSEMSEEQFNIIWQQKYKQYSGMVDAQGPFYFMGACSWFGVYDYSLWWLLAAIPFTAMFVYGTKSILEHKKEMYEWRANQIQER